jgi:hypothetical protein
MRLGLNRRFAEPSLTVPQMVGGPRGSAWAYAIAGRRAARCSARRSSC